MSYYHVPTPKRRSVAWSAIALLAVVSLAAALAAGWSAARPMSATVDGRQVRLMAGTTVGDLAKRGLFSAAPGDVLGVTGSVVETAAGQPARVARNGRYAPGWQRVYDGDVLVSSPGADRTESLVVTETPIPFKTTFEGAGPVLQLKRLGSPGLRRVTKGMLSGIEVTSTVVTPAHDTVYVRSGARPGDKLVALTFDDGPRRGQTDRILDILDDYDVPATFFVVGDRAKAQPAVVRRIAREGHLLGNHSYAHRQMTALDRATIREEVLKGRYAIRDVAGVRTSWFRPPYGSVDREVWDELERLGQQVVMWDVDPRDWARPGTGTIVDNVVKNVKPGSVVLLHDGGNDRRQTIAALPEIIERLEAKGYTFVTVEDLTGERD